jgi:non-specific serine/threonine protein kinase
MVFELCENSMLYLYTLDNNQIKEQLAMKIFIQVLRAVNYLHSLRIAHRDIKPENILFDQ